VKGMGQVGQFEI